MALRRRELLRGAALVAGGAVLGAAVKASPLFAPAHLPIGGGYAAAADHADWERMGQLDVVWRVHTDQPLAALTFDDGPGPQWTPTVLDTLDRYQVPATFFLVGQRLRAHAGLLRGRLDRHEVGNHSWSHPDLARLDAGAVHEQLARADAAIRDELGRTPTLFRPPYGHIGGSTLIAAADFDYTVVLWSRQMRESYYQTDPPGQVRAIVEQVGAGDVVLAHDVGTPDRLIAIDQLGAMITGLRARGVRLVTVSELVRAGRPATVSPVGGDEPTGRPPAAGPVPHRSGVRHPARERLL